MVAAACRHARRNDGAKAWPGACCALWPPMNEISSAALGEHIEDSQREPRAWQRSRSLVLVLGMLGALFAIASLSLWDVHRRNAESMDDFGQYQARLARSVANDLNARLHSGVALSGEAWRRTLLDLHALDQLGSSITLLSLPGRHGFVDLVGHPAPDGLLLDAIAEGHAYVRLHRDIAAKLGLPQRTAVAGLAQATSPMGQRVLIATVATALRASDREKAASLRALLSVLVAAASVLALGGVAWHWQRQELRTQQQLAVEEAHRRCEADLERASRAATLGTLAMGITHELSTPLSIIAARAEQLRSRLGSDDRAARGLQVIQDQAARMEQVIRGILALVRDQPPIAHRLSALDVCHGAMSLVRHRFAETGRTLRLQASSHASKWLLRGDQRLLEQALVNLLLNACDACASGGHVTLQVQAQASQVRFRVTDDGVGISSEAAARAMEPFFTTKPAGKGAGLGLAVTHEIVKSHRGTLRIGPLPGRGTCAEIILPQAEEDSRHGD